jgi:MoxR-like ATPase
LDFDSSSAELRAASERFRAFFQELGRVFVEREDVLAQVALGLLGREHVLMTGPPGTAKSGIAAAVLGRIVDEKTGEPSVFARQFTESTVQTDLVGPIDFKTLMATGRTEHFTDEGMLGAVHAFLDEVLDGRDMLLRTTLNVLHERELKQGTKTTQGRIECALMTTNRYLAEVLEGSRETLLAFIDRIAFVGFVPKGFTDPESMGKVLRSQVGGARRALKAHLTIQDLDVLQAAAERVIVSDDILAALAVLLGHLDTDLGAAAKSDPTFLPTRYLSTRTAVRLGKLLRSVCMYDTIMSTPGREPVAEVKDFGMLRLSLLLSGPDRAGITKLLDKESDPRERRQLSILRTEREIFDRALARVPNVERKPQKQKKAPAGIDGLAAAVERALPRDDPKELLATAAKLAEAADAGNASAPQAASLLATTLSHLAERALRAGTTAGAGPHERTLDVVPELASLADGLEAASGTTRPVARWLRGRAIQLLLDGAALSGARVGEALDAEMPVDATLQSVKDECERALSYLSGMLATCAQLRAAGADEPAGQPHDAAIAVAVLRVEDELVELLDTGFRDAVAGALTGPESHELRAVLRALTPSLEAIDAVDAALVRLGGKSGVLKARVVGPRVEPLVRSAFDRVEGRDRLELVEQVGALVAQLDKSGLKAVIPPADLLRLAAGALVRSEQTAAPTPKPKPNHEGYRALRASEQRVSLTYTIVELALRVAPDRPLVTDSPGELVKALGGLVGALPDGLRAEIVALDLGRVERAVALVNAWWKSLAKIVEAASASGETPRLGSALTKLADSKFFHVTRDEGALLRFALECRVVGEVFPEADSRAAALRAAIDAMETESSAALNTLRRGRAEAGWSELLTAPRSTKGA